MSSVKGRERILIHLFEISSDNGGMMVSENHYNGELPYQVCQKGIAEEVDLSISRTSRLINSLKEKDLIKEHVKRVKGFNRRRKVYILTPKGFTEAKRIIRELKNKKVTLKTKTSDIKLNLGEIDSYIETDNPLLTAINNLKEGSEVHLESSDVEKGNVFINRTEELKFLSDRLSEIKRNGSATLLIRGPAGIGKTRLFKEFKHQNRSEDVDFLMCKGHFQTSESFLPFKKLFGEYKNMFSGTLEKVQSLSEKDSLVIFIDDLQWADRSSLTLFHYLANNLEEVPVLLLGAYRPEEIYRRDFLNDIIQRMERENLMEELTLEPFDLEDSRDMIEKIIGRVDIPEDFTDIIYRKAEGNPFFLKELTNHLLEKEIVNPQENDFPTSIEDVELPEVIEKVIQRRMRKLDKETFKVLQIGSIIGENIPSDLLSSVTDKDPVDLFDHVDTLTNLGIWEVESEEELLCFSHGLIHKEIYDEVLDPLKNMLHLKVAESIEDLHDEELDNFYSDLGFHYNKAMEYSKAYEYYKKAAEKAENKYGCQNAIDLYSKALHIAVEGDLSDKKRWSIMEKLADLHQKTGKYKEALDFLEKIQEEEPSSDFKKKVSCKIAELYEYKGRYENAINIVEDNLEEYTNRSEVEDVELGRLLQRRGWIKMNMGRYESAERDFKKALEVVKKMEDEKEIAQIKHALGTVRLRKGDHQGAIDSLKESLKIKKDSGDLEGKAVSLINLSEVYLKEGELEKALDKIERSLEILKDTGEKTTFSIALLNKGNVHLRKGEMERAHEYYLESLNQLEDLGHFKGLSICLNNLGNHQLKEGECEVALENYQRSLEISEDIDFRYGLALTSCNMGKAYAEKGEFSKAEEHLNRSLEISRDIGSDVLIIYGLLILADVLVEKGELGRALEEVQKVLPLLENKDLEEYQKLSRQVIGKIYVERVNRERKRLKMFGTDEKIDMIDPDLEGYGTANLAL